MGVLKVWDGTTWQLISSTAASAAYVGPNAPTGTPNTGDMWYDTDETSTNLVLPLSVAQGGTGASNAGTARTNLGVNLPLGLVDGGTGGTSAAAARTSLAVPSIGNSTTTAGAPTTGTWARGDQYLDSNNVIWTCSAAGTPGTWMPPSGYEWAFNQITTSVTLTSTNAAAANLVIEGTTRTYDGSPIIVEFYCGCMQEPTNAVSNQASFVNLWDASTDIGMLGEVYGGSANSLAVPVFVRRKITPTVGSHNFRVAGYMNGGTGGAVLAGAGTSGVTFPPAYIRVTRA